MFRAKILGEGLKALRTQLPAHPNCVLGQAERAPLPEFTTSRFMDQVTLRAHGKSQEELGYLTYVEPDAKGVARWCDLLVHPQYCNQGLGAALVSRGLQAMREEGASEVKLWVEPFAEHSPSRAALKQFYARYGARFEGDFGRIPLKPAAASAGAARSSENLGTLAAQIGVLNVDGAKQGAALLQKMSRACAPLSCPS